MRSISFIVVLLLLAWNARAQSCYGTDSKVELAVAPENLLRKNVPKTLFGFDLPWYDAQVAYMRDGEFRKEFIAWMMPFKGAIYRYPAGTNTFEWRKAVGPQSKRREVFDLYVPDGSVMPQLGPEEFLKLMELVGGQPLWMLRMLDAQAGSARKESKSDFVAENVDYAKWILGKGPEICKTNSYCRINTYELGNELDWGDLKWSASKYATAASTLLRRMKEVDPRGKMVVMGKTSPWDSPEKATDALGDSFDQAVAKSLGAQSDGVSIHPYYDGLPINELEPFINRLSQVYRRHNADHKVYVTEHGRWPSIPKIGRWEDNWHQASGSQGALSAVDFTMSMMRNKNVDVAVWHALGAKGPWQLIKWDERRDELYPSPTYWGLRLLRESYFDHLVQVQPAELRGGDYGGGYSIKTVAMLEEGARRMSVVSVNRSSSGYWVKYKISSDKFQDEAQTVRYFEADEKGTDHVDGDKNRFRVKRFSGAPVKRAGHVCVPPHSIISLQYTAR
ncbi:hypothetical protein ACG0Z6_09650 [Roseateles sp. BYS180W]|uniref:Alpha-L-arabinofuranosidase n=1 Tax=Roseateles rivi TaxID=3299028 RepID=A0ABW7FW30_9BURK